MEDTQNVELFSKEGEISANTTIKSLSRQAGRNIMQKGKAKLKSMSIKSNK